MKEIYLTSEFFPDENFRNALKKELKISEGSYIGSKLNTKELILDHYDIIDIDGIQYFTSLEKLSLSGNPISTLKYFRDYKINFKNLKYLILSSCKITESHVFPLKHLTRLVYLDVSNNRISEKIFERALNHLPYLEYLDLSSNDVEEFTLDEEVAGNLKFLSISFNPLKKLWTTCFENLEVFRISCQNLSDSGQDVRVAINWSSKNIKELSISDYTLETDLSFIGDLPNITTLYLNDCNLTDISFITRLTKLTKLVFNYKDISDDEIKALSALPNLNTLMINHKIIDDSTLDSLKF